jgi:hypothetical protein
MLRFLKLPNGFQCFFLTDRVIQKEGLYVNIIYNMVEKHLRISIAPVQSRGGSLVVNKSILFNICSTAELRENNILLSVMSY